MSASANKLPVTSRVLAAFFGGYILATSISIAVARIFSGAQSEAVISAVLISFIVWLLAIIWSFYSKTAKMAWFGLVLPSVAIGVVTWLITK